MILRRSLMVLALLGGLATFFWLRGVEHVENAKTAPYSLIEEGLYVGGSVKAPPPGTQAVVNLCRQEDPYQADFCLNVPIDGSQPPTIDWLRRVVEFIDEQRRAGHTTYVHCLAGMNRSGMVVTAYLMYEHGWTRDRALKFAQSKRPQIFPNSTMMRLLAEWELALKEER